MKDQLKDEDQITSTIRRKIKESIEPAFKSIEATQTAYASALENVAPTLKQLDATTIMLSNLSAQNPRDKINIQQSIETIEIQ